ncbi:MAG: NUDIX domain-containing protein [Clostridia bacterium]|nr:NUDIX domain-containing protein [Clostridia bacterium]
MEIWDLYTENKELVGIDHERGKPLPEGLYHMVVHVWIVNSKGEYIITQRAANRPTFPLMWECVGGSALKGENGLDAALREVKEEIELSLSPENGTLINTFVRKNCKDIVEVWLFKYDGDVLTDGRTTDEVAQARWMNADEIKQLFEQDIFVPTLTYFLDII